MAYTVDEYNALKSAFAQGALEVQYADKKVTYGAASDMLRRIKVIENEMGIIPAKPQVRYAQHSKGLQ